MKIRPISDKAKRNYLEGKLERFEDEVIYSILYEESLGHIVYRKLFGMDRYREYCSRMMTKAEHIRQQVVEHGGELRESLDCFCCGKELVKLS